MKITTKSKQMLLIGLASLMCVVVLYFAIYHTELNSQSVENSATPMIRASSSGFPSGESVSAKLPQRDSSSRIPIVNRIPAVDNSSEQYPVQPAAFDSIHWESQVDTADQVPLIGSNSKSATRPPTALTMPISSLPTTADAIRIARLPGDGVTTDHFPPSPELNPLPPGLSRSFSHGPSSVGTQEPKVILNNDFVPSTGAVVNELANRPIINPYVVQPPPERTKTKPKTEIAIKGNHSLRIKGVFPFNDPPKESEAFAPAGSANGLTIVNNEFIQTEVQEKVLDLVDPGSPSMFNDHSTETAAVETITHVTGTNATQLDEPIETVQFDDLPPNPETAPNLNSTGNTQPQHRLNNIDFFPHLAQETSSILNQPLPSSAEPPTGGELPSQFQGAEKFVLAAEPKIGEHWKDDRPVTDRRALLMEPIKDDFSPDPIQCNPGYDAYQQIQVYEGKTLNANQRPILELGRPYYQLGQLGPGYNWFGKHNNIAPQFLIYGDVRTAAASSTQNGDNVSQIAFEVNLDFDLKLTGTERFHMFLSPLDNGQNSRWLLDEDEFIDETDADIEFGYFEGDLGAMVGGFTNQTLPFDLPFAIGVMPLILQNGVWMEDAFLGVAATLPARSSAKLNISNMDVTFFAGYDKIVSDAFVNDDSAARMYGVASFIDALNGYIEIDYAFLDDRTDDNRSYHNVGFGYSRRYGRLFSNSTRVIANAGQATDVVENTADGVLLLSENSLITRSPSTVVPYLNLFAGFDRPQSAARALEAGGILRNTGILFESDGMTNYPTLDATANDTFGGALGLNLLADDFSQQLVVEMAMLGVMGEDANRNAPGSQYGVGFRYQLPLTNAIIFRADGMYGFLENDQDVRGIRLELRHKY